MLSRVADSIYWMARYVERAENLARFIDVTQSFILDQPYSSQQNHWKPLVQVTGDDDEFESRFDGYNATNVLRFLTFDRDYPNSIISSLTAARENARSIREVISSEVWEQLNDFYHLVKHCEGRWLQEELDEELFHNIKTHSHAFNGLLDSTMTHGIGWHFANMGRLLERADKTSRLLDVKYFTLLPNLQDVGTTLDDLQWSAVLKSVSGFEMYRKQFQLVSLPKIVQFLVLDQSFPRSIRYCLEEAETSLRAIGNQGVRRKDQDIRNEAEQALFNLNQKLADLEAKAIIEKGLHEFIDGLQKQLNQIGSLIYQRFIAMRSADEVSETKGCTGKPPGLSQSQKLTGMHSPSVQTQSQG